MHSGQSHSKLASQMADACDKFLESLSAPQRAKTIYNFADGERFFWFYPPLNRHGLPLRDMEPHQRKLALDILAVSLPEKSYKQALQIVEHENVLGAIEKEQNRITFVRDPQLYYFIFFGQPGEKDPWGWRFEGHHVSLNFSVWDKEVVSVTPFFFGSNPAEVRKGPKKGLRILGDREDLAFDLIDSFDKTQRSKAVIWPNAPWDILTYNSARATLPEYEGLPVSKMSGSQREMLMALVSEYVNQARPEVAKDKLTRLQQEDFDKLHFAWGGPISKDKEHYYRIHGGNFVVEFDNRQNGANHIHSVWRDVNNDFAQDVLRDHLLLFHIL
ncbi:MAG: DUF3500 domain-containing protein [SAR202 cluster bacterium]|nr:DUF3500 domain-containing protein [SAR202 cluster bacterium]